MFNVDHFTNLFHEPLFSWDAAQPVFLRHRQTPFCGVFLVNVLYPRVAKFGSNIFTNF